MEILIEKFTEDYNINLSKKSIANLKILDYNRKPTNKYIDDIATIRELEGHIEIIPNETSKKIINDIVISLSKHSMKLFPQVINNQYIKVNYPIKTTELRNHIYNEAKQYAIHMKKVMFDDMNKVYKKILQSDISSSIDSTKMQYNTLINILKTYNDKINHLLEDKKYELKLNN